MKLVSPKDLGTMFILVLFIENVIIIALYIETNTIYSVNMIYNMHIIHT